MRRRQPSGTTRFNQLRSHLVSKRMAAKLQYDRSALDRLTLLQLKAATPPEVRDKSFDVRIVSRHYETGRKDGFKRTRAKYPTIYNQVRVYSRDTSKTGSGKKHLSLIRFFGPPDARTPCWVWCDCGYYQYTLEWANSKNNSSSLKNSNGEPATVRNPAGDGWLCKHLFRAAEWALTRREDKASRAMDQLVEKQQGKKNASSSQHHAHSTPGRRFGR